MFLCDNSIYCLNVCNILLKKTISNRTGIIITNTYDNKSTIQYKMTNTLILYTTLCSILLTF